MQRIKRFPILKNKFKLQKYGKKKYNQRGKNLSISNNIEIVCH